MNLQFFLLLGLALSASSCRTGDKEISTTFVDGENPSIPLNVDGNSEDVPKFLWSPSQRKATASHTFLVAEYVSLSGDIKKASKKYRTAYNLDPNPFLAAKLIRAHASTGNLDNAMKEAKKMVLLYPTSSELRLLYGQLLSRQGVYYNAVKELEKSLEIGPASEQAYTELINLHLNNNLTKRAIVVADEYAKAFSNSAAAWAKLAQLYMQAGQHKKAIQPARTAYELQSMNPEFALLYAILSEMNGDRKRAVALYEQLYRLDPGNEELIARMIALYKNLGDLNVALDLLDELSKINNDRNPGIDVQKAFVLWELGRFDEAAKILEELSQRFPESERLTYMKALGFERTKRQEEAIEIYQKIPESSSFYAESRFRLMVVLKDLKKYGEAEQVVDKVIDDNETTWEYFVIAAGIKGELEKSSEAVDLLAKGFEKFPKQTRLLFLKGVYQEKAGDVDETIKTMQQVIKLDKQNSTALNFLGYLYAERGENLEEAEKLIKKALEIKPGDGYYLDSLGWVYFQRGDYQNAKATLEKALEKLPDEGVVLEHLADVYEKLGNKEKAFEYLERAAKGRLDDRDKKRILDKYEKAKSQRKGAH